MYNLEWNFHLKKSYGNQKFNSDGINKTATTITTMLSSSTTTLPDTTELILFAYDNVLRLSLDQM